MPKIIPTIGHKPVRGSTPGFTPSPPQPLADRNGNTVRVESAQGVSTNEPGVVKAQGATQ